MRAVSPVRDPDRERLLIHAILALVAVLFSLHYIIGKIALRSFEPLTFAYLRVAGSGAGTHSTRAPHFTGSFTACWRPEFGRGKQIHPQFV